MTEPNVLRILVSVESAAGDQPWTATFSAPDRPARAAWQPTRTLQKAAIGGHNFPAVDAGEPGLPDPGEAHHALCTGADPDALKALYRRITRRAPVAANKDVSTFGKYLFDTLVGRDIWQEIVALAQEEAADVLELALAWDAGEVDLHRLNWEMMHGPQDFLAAKLPTTPREVAITRLVLGAGQEPATLGAIPRCLFVIGTALTDWRIRPGAEYLGLLRQIERSGRAIHTRVLRGQKGQGATPTDLRRAMTDFGPELVHFICHGKFDDRGNAHLELAAEPDEQDQSKLRDTGMIFQYLSEGETLPAIVVLSACNTGQADADEQDLLAPGAPVEGEGERPEVELRGAHETAPMAARLVARGIPVVIGMAGRVADSACRHFTRRFGEAVVRGEPLVRATADGRRAAFAYDDQSPEESVDWAFPAVFVSARVPADYRPTPPALAGSMPPVEEWVTRYHKKRGNEPVLCGRHKFFDAYYDLFRTDKPSVLGAYVVPVSPLSGGPDLPQHEQDRGFGKTRLLRELTVQAIRDGHIPVVVSSDSRNWEPPKTLPDLLIKLFKALNETRRIYDLPRTTWQISALQRLLQGQPAELHPDVEEIYLEENSTVNARVIREALAVDMTYFIEQAHADPRAGAGAEPSEQALARHAFFQETQGSAILFLDEVHKYDEAFVDDWFGSDVLGQGGLRRDSAVRLHEDDPWDPARTVLPVVMTFSTAGAPNIIFTSIKERGQSLGRMRLEPLQPFPTAYDVDLLAYEHVLLNPFDERGELVDNVSNRAFFLNRETSPQNWENWCGFIRNKYGGLPRYFETKDCYWTVDIAEKNDFLKKADEEQQLEKYMGNDADHPG